MTSRAVMSMRWLSLAFIHWRVDAQAVRAMRPRIPDDLEVDTFDGAAWVGLVPFTMRDVRPAWSPSIPLMSHFHECNVRTYVKRCRGRERGVWFFSLDAASRLAVWGARRFWHLPYHHARMSLQREGDEIHYRLQRRSDRQARLECSWRIGSGLATSRDGELAHFLTERYSLYAADPRGRVWRGPIMHDPWPLREAALTHLEDGLLAAAGLRERLHARDAIVHHADELRVRASALERCEVMTSPAT